MNNENLIIEELIKIRKLLTIFSQDKLDDFNSSIKDKYLSTPERELMYELFDGCKSLKEIATSVNVSTEAVRQFSSSLEQAGLVEMIEINKKQKNPKRIF